MPKFLSAMAWFTKENLIDNRTKAAIPMIAMVSSCLWYTQIFIYIQLYTHAKQSKNESSRA